MSRASRRQLVPGVEDALGRIDQNYPAVYRAWRGHFGGDCNARQLRDHLLDEHEAAPWIPSLPTLRRWLEEKIVPLETRLSDGRNSR